MQASTQSSSEVLALVQEAIQGMIGSQALVNQVCFYKPTKGAFGSLISNAIHL